MTRIGTSDLEVFPLSLGGNVFGWTSDEHTSRAVLDAFVDGGGNFIDTADGYSAWVPGNTGGDSERIIGGWLSERSDRDALVIATKVGQHPDFRGLGAGTVAAAARASLQRLGTDHIDLYYAHFDDESVPLDETVGAFQELVTDGLVRYVGISNYSPARIQQWIDLTTAHGYAPPVALQPHYNLVEREPFESAYAPVAAANELGVMPYFALAKGFLTGKYRSAGDADGSARGGAASKYLDAHGLTVVDTLVGIADAHGVAPASVALAWLRRQPTVAAPIASARTVDQLPALLASAELTLTDSEIALLDQVSSVAVSQP